MRLRAAASTTESIQVGSCHETTSPSAKLYGSAAKPAAMPSARSQNSRKVTRCPWSSTSISRSGVDATLASMSSQRLPPVIGICQARTGPSPPGHSMWACTWLPSSLIQPCPLANSSMALKPSSQSWLRDWPCSCWLCSPTQPRTASMDTQRCAPSPFS